jgi:hypothetical protein
MWFTSKSRNRECSRSTERWRAQGSQRRRTSFRPHTEALDERWLLSTLTVMNANDSGAGSLRAEIAAAKSKDTIVFDAGLDGQTITLTSGELYVNTSLSINGPGAAQLTVSGGNSSRIFEVAAKNQVTASGLTISNGNGNSGGSGGGILNQGNLTVSNCTLTGNQSLELGGGIDNLGTLTVTGSTLTGNSARSGGAIANYDTTTISNSSLSANSTVYGDGGAFYNYGSASISSSTLAGNVAAGSQSYGGAIDNDTGSLTLSNSTFSDNFAQYGSAIYMNHWNSKVTVAGCSLTDSVTGGYLIWVNAGTLTVKNSYFHNGGANYYICGPYKDLGGNTFA